MSWFWGKSDSSSENATSGLDPSLREFLDRSSSAKAKAIPPAETQSSYRERVGLVQPEPSVQGAADGGSSSSDTVVDRGVTKDGIWKNYKPLEQLEMENKTDQEKLRDLWDHMQDQKHAVGQVARENCTFEEIEDEQRKQIRCFEMQQKFLKALGYMNLVNRKDLTVADETRRREELQMHADSLYRQMLARERSISLAKAGGEGFTTSQTPVSANDIDRGDQKVVADSGKSRLAASVENKGAEADSSEQDTPKGIVGWAVDGLASLITPAPPDVRQLDLSDIPVTVRKHFVARLTDRYNDGGISPEELSIEKEAFKAELHNEESFALGWIDLREQEKNARAKRWENKNPTIGDRVKRMWDKE